MNDLLPAPDQAKMYRQLRYLDKLPPASEHLNYNGDVTGSIGNTFGPNLDGEWLTMVSCDYDPATGKSRAGFAYGAILVTGEED